MRLTFIDSLRVFATGFVFVFHCAHVFDGLKFHVSNPESSVGYLIFVVFTIMWIMPLFFALAGVSAAGSLEKRGAGAFLRERLTRLVLPYCVGVLVLIPPQKYVEAVSWGYFSGSFFEFLPFLAARIGDVPHGPEIFGSLGHHLWFLAFLFLYSLAIIPVNAFLKSERGGRFLARYSERMNARAASFSLSVPFAVAYPLLKPLFPAYSGWADFAFMLLFFATSFIDARAPGVLETRARERWLHLTVSLTTFIILLRFLSTFGTGWFDYPSYTPLSLGGYALWAIGSRSMVLFFFGLAKARVTKPFPRAIKGSVMTFYLLHQTVILLIAFYVVRMSRNLHLKFLAVVTVSLAITVALCAVAYRVKRPRHA